MSKTEYTEKQLKIISGEIPIESVNGYTLRFLYTKALANGDEELLLRTEKQREKLKKEQYRRKNQRSAERVKKIRHNEEIKWKQPKSNEYTEHQKKIVRGEIPYEEVHTNELISIHLKAHNIGDYELSERLLDLITARREESIEKETRRKNEYKRLRQKVCRSLKSIDSDIGQTDTTLLEQSILLGLVTVDDCSEQQLLQVITSSQKRNNEKLYGLAKAMLYYKQNPEAIYSTRNHQEAIDLIEKLLGIPIRRPETWFVDENKDKE